MSASPITVKLFKLELNACTNDLAKLLESQNWHGVIVAWHPQEEEAWIVSQTVGKDNEELERAQRMLGKALEIA